MAGWILLLAALDVAIVILLVLWLMPGSREREGADSAALEKCRELRDSLRTLVLRAEEVSAGIVSEIDRESNLAGQVLDRLQREKQEARLLMEESQRLLGISEERLVAAQSYEPSERKYEEALELHRQGLSREEILRRLDIGDGELDVVLSLHTG